VRCGDAGKYEKRSHVAPLQGMFHLNTPIPRALPWAVMLVPLPGRSDGNQALANYYAQVDDVVMSVANPVDHITP